jgi:hypothetical protein
MCEQPSRFPVGRSFTATCFVAASSFLALSFVLVPLGYALNLGQIELYGAGFEVNWLVLRVLGLLIFPLGVAMGYVA